MSRKELEEILEECLSAYLEGRRTIEASLRLYPWVADELEPLLRTAVFVTEQFSPELPPAHVIERGRNRFLRAARVRQMTGTSIPSRVLGGKRRWVLLPAALAVPATAAVIAAAVLAGGDEQDARPVVVLHSPVPSARESAALASLQTEIEDVLGKSISGAEVSSSDIERLELLASQVDPDLLDAQTREQLASLGVQLPGEDDAPTPTPTERATPSPSPGGTPSPSPSPSPGSSATPAP